MFFLVYQVTNLINGKIYVGIHKTKNIDDGYMGSGLLIKTAQKKYGIENFKKEILAECSTAAEMFEMESLIVNQEFVSSNGTYNLKVGGIGGFDHINETRTQEESVKIGLDAWNGRDEDEKTQHLQNMRDTLKKIVEEHGGTFKGKKHSDETKRKISEKASVHQKGEKNSQAGSAWMYNLEQKVNIKIKKDEIEAYEVLGWNKGRKMSF
jgi:hypothetical protein